MHSSYFPSSMKLRPTSRASDLVMALFPYFLRSTSGEVFVPSFLTSETALFAAADERSSERDPFPPMSELLPVAGLDAVPVEVLPVDGVDVPVDVFPDDELPLDDEVGFTPVEDCFPVLPVPVADELPPVDGVDVPPLEDAPVDVFPDDELPLDDEDGFTPAEEFPPEAAFLEFSVTVSIPTNLPLPVDGVAFPTDDVEPEDEEPVDGVDAFADELPVDVVVRPESELSTVTEGFVPRPPVDELEFPVDEPSDDWAFPPDERDPADELPMLDGVSLPDEEFPVEAALPPVGLTFIPRPVDSSRPVNPAAPDEEPIDASLSFPELERDGKFRSGTERLPSEEFAFGYSVSDARSPPSFARPASGALRSFLAVAEEPMSSP